MFGRIISFALILAGFYGLANAKNLIKTIIYLNISQASAILLFLNLVYFKDSQVPILRNFSSSMMVDPVPQALMITAIVIGASVTSLALIISIKLSHNYGSLNWKDLRERND